MALQSKESRVLRYEENTRERNLSRVAILHKGFPHLRACVVRIFLKTNLEKKAHCKVGIICLSEYAHNTSPKVNKGKK